MCCLSQMDPGSLPSAPFLSDYMAQWYHQSSPRPPAPSPLGSGACDPTTAHFELGMTLGQPGNGALPASWVCFAPETNGNSRIMATADCLTVRGPWRDLGKEVVSIRGTGGCVCLNCSTEHGRGVGRGLGSGVVVVGLSPTPFWGGGGGTFYTFYTFLSVREEIYATRTFLKSAL